MEDWYLLFDGSSPDGRGTPKYVGRTTDPEVAKQHAERCNQNPYSTGQVIKVTDTEHTYFPE